MKRLIAALALILLTGVARDAWACTCGSDGSACTAFNGTPAVFVGLVESIDEDMAEVTRFGRREQVRVGLTARFRVQEPLKGVTTATVEVATGGSDADCGYEFRKGERYLVYAYRTEGAALGSAATRTVIGSSASSSPNALRTSLCSRTRHFDNAEDDLALLRALNAGTPETRIFGSVHQFLRPLGTYEYRLELPGPIAGIPVRAIGPSRSLSTNTDAQGRYRFVNPPPGTYTLRIEPPPGFAPPYDPTDVASTVTVTRAGCSAAHDFMLQIDGRISGRVLDAQGRPVTDQVRVSLATRASAGRGFGQVESRSGYTKAGRYEMDGIPPGEYILGISIVEPPTGNTPYPTWYHPGVTVLRQATAITLRHGQHITDMDLRLPESSATVMIVGVIVRPDGSPAANASVELYDAAAPSVRLFGMDAKTNALGQFSIKAFEGREYLIRAYLPTDYLAGTGIQSDRIRVRARAGTPEGLTLVLNRNGVF